MQTDQQATTLSAAENIRYVYFVSYRFPSGFGGCEVVRNKCITSIEDIEEVERALWLDNHTDGIRVMNYELLRTEGEVNG